jgi:hypothetical protein
MEYWISEINKQHNKKMNHHCRCRHWQNSPFWAIAFLRRFCQICLFHRELDYPVSTALDFATIQFLKSKVISLVSNPQPGGSSLCIYVLQWQHGQLISPGTKFRFVEHTEKHIQIWEIKFNLTSFAQLQMLQKLLATARLLWAIEA